jgi:phage terminase small subunit
MVDTLTQQQENFCMAYVETGNASEAYRRAYPRSHKWKESSVNVEASKRLREPKISHRVRELQQEARKRHDITMDRILSDIRETADVAMGRKPSKRTVIRDGKRVELEVREFNGAVALKALDMLARHLGLYDQKEERTDIRVLIQQFIRPTNKLPRDQGFNEVGR